MATYISHKICPNCKESNVMEVDAEKYGMWQSGMLIQQVFPELSLDQREALQSGYHAECWEATFGGDE